MPRRPVSRSRRVRHRVQECRRVEHAQKNAAKTSTAAADTSAASIKVTTSLRGDRLD